MTWYQDSSQNGRVKKYHSSLDCAQGFTLAPAMDNTAVYSETRCGSRSLSHHRTRSHLQSLSSTPLVLPRIQEVYQSGTRPKRKYHSPAGRVTFLSANLYLSACVLILCMLVRDSAGVHYAAPDDCDWRTLHPGGAEVIVTCHLQTISDSGRTTNFSLIQSEHTTSVVVICDPVFFESHLSNASLSHLRYLKSLRIEQCKIPRIPSRAFQGLSDLKNLTIRTYNGDWGALTLRVHYDSLRELKALERLDFGANSVPSLPPSLFCSLSSLKTLNLTRNRLKDVKSVKLTHSNPAESVCLPELLELDLSYNHLRELQDGDFSFLKNLKHLYLQNNLIERLHGSSFFGLNKLQTLDVSSNFVTGVAPQSLKHLENLRELCLQNNSIRSLPPGVFSGLQQLLILNVSRNMITSDSVTSDTFVDLIRLVILDLSHNQLRTLNGSTFQSQYSLQILYVDNNYIESIVDNTFASLYNLHTLSLGHNRLKDLDAFTLNGLYVMSSLSLASNLIHTINHEAFKNCSSLQNLRLDRNKLTFVPKALEVLQFLKTLDLSANNITEVSNSSFRGLKQLIGLDLSRNTIGNLTRGPFREVSTLQHLNLSCNRITSLEHGIFDDAPELKTILLNDNRMADINGLFMNLHNLEVLNVSRNRITWFDYALIAVELKTLDIHDNQIELMGNYFELENVLQLQTLDASHNSLKEINAASFPHLVETLYLNSNKITVIHPFAFMPKSNLTQVDLRNNSFQTVDINAFRLKTIPSRNTLPEFYVSGNPYFCDCTMEWLQRINNLDDTRQYPKIMDFEQIVCKLPFIRHYPFLPLSQANSSDFLCKYKSHCFALCHCCEFDACDCEMVCPEDCTCYSDQTWNTNIVDCSNTDISIMPQRVPMDVTELYLDGDEFSHLTSHAFIGRKNLKVLYLNNSNVQIINNRTFNGLQALQILHLEDNKLTILHGFEFEHLHKLRELHLSGNRIAVINNNTFIALKVLEVLRIDHNFLVEFQVWNLNYNPRLTDVQLGNNPWNCNCQFMEDFQDWLQVFGSSYVRDPESIRCYYNQTPGPYLLEFNASACTNYSAVTFFQAAFVENYMPLMIIGPSLFLIILCVLILAYVYRREMKIWLYSRYGVRLFHKRPYAAETEKLFDAFLSYCKKDEAFVAQMLAPELECGNPPYRLCLRYRDLPMSGYVSEAITEAIECSHRTVVVLSEQFLKSEWCRFELKTAHHETQCNRHHRLVVVLLDKTSFKDMDPDARLCLRAVPVIRWGDKRFWEKLRYSMPDGQDRRKLESKMAAHPSIRCAQENSVRLV